MHPFAVAKILAVKGFGLDYQITGLFHDLLEDIDATDEELLEMSNEKVVAAVKLLTKETNYVMQDYVSKIEGNEIAKIVKLADRTHNLFEAHLASKEFIENYIIETKQWYLKMAEGTPFAKDLNDMIESLEDNR